MVLGPSRSGKTSSLVVPNVLCAPGAVVSTSTKGDVLALTSPARAAVGQTLLYDPSGTVEAPPGVQRVGWSPVCSAGHWDGALVVADAMVGAARGRSATGPIGEDHWTERAGALLAPLLHAAALDGSPMGTVLHWVDRHDASRALEVLAARAGDDAPATDVLAGIAATDAREQSGIWSTCSGVLGAYRSTAALASSQPPYLDATAFCEGANTLYVCAPGSRQRLFAPLVVGMVAEVRDAAYRRTAGGRTQPPVLLALDEVANIAPLPDLPALVSEGVGQGLVTLACLQDLSQARARWGPQADAFFSLFATSVVLRGIADPATLHTLSALAGEADVLSRSVTRTAGGGRRQMSVGESLTRRHRMPVDVIARGVPGWGLVLDAHNHLGWVRLTPVHRSPRWRGLVHEDAGRVRRDLGTGHDTGRGARRELGAGLGR